MKTIGAAALMALLLAVLAGATGGRAATLTSLPAVFPTPQSLRPTGGAVVVPSRLRLVALPGADDSALAVVRQALRGAGVTTIARGGHVPAAGLTVLVGHDAALERSLGVAGPKGLPAGGYVLVARPLGAGAVVLLDGVDAAGQYYAAQTLRQLLAGRRSLSALVVRDWPSFPLRGIVEGYHGVVWPEAARLDMLDFMGRNKLDFFTYLPKDDPYVRADWRAPFPPARLRQLAALVRRATRDHVTFGVGISPGDSVCYSSSSDLAALTAKLQALWGIGVRSFTIAFDDIVRAQPECADDAALFGSDDAGLARAQAYLANRVDLTFVRTHHGALPLMVVPAVYAGVAPTAYQTAFATALGSDVTVQWTGPYGVSAQISTTDALAARSLYGHPLVVWDNYFVNDYLPGTLVLGPYVGRDRTLATAAGGILVDPMNEPEVNKIGLFTVADYTWNTAAYNPARSWTASLDALAGGDPAAAGALGTFAGVNRTASAGQAPELETAIAAFWQAWDADDPNAPTALRADLVRLRDAPGVLRARLADPPFLAEAALWLNATQLLAGAAVDALDALVDQRSGLAAAETTASSEARALREEAVLLTVPDTNPPASLTIAGGALTDLIHYALRGYGP